jgi:hypothetical protein
MDSLRVAVLVGTSGYFCENFIWTLHVAKASSLLPFLVIHLVNLDTFLFTVAASQFSRHSVTGRRLCLYS